MAYVAVDKDETEVLAMKTMERRSEDWSTDGNFVILKKGSIEKLIGKKLTWEDEPAELKE